MKSPLDVQRLGRGMTRKKSTRRLMNSTVLVILGNAVPDGEGS